VLRFKVTEDGNYIKLIDFSLNSERTALFSFFKKKSKAASFNVLVDRGIWDGFDHFITKDSKIAIGLWKEIYNFSEKMGYDCEIEGIDAYLNLNLSKEKYDLFVKKLLDGIIDERGNPIVPRDYQAEGAYRALKYKFSTQELATSAGKTLIFYIFNSVLKAKGIINQEEKSLIIVPNVSLVGQTAEKFEMYSNGVVSWKVATIGGDDKFDQQKFEESDILITTYQSLINFHPDSLESKLVTLNKKLNKAKEEEKESLQNQIVNLRKKILWAKNYNIFAKFSVVNIDETHKSRGNSIQEILVSCLNWKYRLGLSGTVKIDEKYSDFYRVQENVGPLVMVLSAKHLTDHGYSPNIEIKVLQLKYDEADPKIQKYWSLKETGKSMYNSPKDFGRDMLAIEKDIIFESQERLNLINNLVKKLGKNTLILFSDIKNEYGKKIYQKLLEWNPNTFYIDGEVKSQERDSYKNTMEAQDDVIIVASFGTFSTGIDLKNVHHIIFAESTKAEITIRQSIGRGMRKLAGKIKVIIWDLVDLLDGYMVKHGEVREQIYKDQKFKVTKNKVDLTKNT
jgi:superfamily II DNA or RNA helicase